MTCLGYAVTPEVKGAILFSSHDVLIDNSFQSFDSDYLPAIFLDTSIRLPKRRSSRFFTILIKETGWFSVSR